MTASGVALAPGITAHRQRRPVFWTRLALPAILTFGLALRLAAASVPSIHHPDEVFQYLETAHRLVFGYGVMPWEYRWGIRSWLFPAILAGPMAIGGWLSPGGDLYLALPRLVMIAVSLVLPICGWAFGAVRSRGHAAMAALIMAAWSEFVYFAPHTLTENLATALLLVGAALLLARRGAAPTRAVAGAGLAIGLAVLVRFQVAPMAAIVTIAGCRRSSRCWRALAAGGAAAAALGAVVESASGAVPFAWLIENVRQNLIGNRAAQYGVTGPLGYLTWFEHLWGWSLLAIAPLAWAGGKRQPALLWAAVANIVFHSLIAHKEYRFVEASAVIVILLAALGTGDMIELVRRRFPVAMRWHLGTVAVLLWAGASASIATGSAMRDVAGGATDKLAMTAAVRSDPAACGVAMLHDFVDWGGYTHLHRPIPVSFFADNDPALAGTTTKAALSRWGAGYNRIVAASVDRALLPAGYAERRCESPATCLFVRPGSCAAMPGSPFAAQRVFDRNDRWMRENIRRGLHPVS